MEKTTLTFCIIAVILSCSMTAVMAGGDKVRGDNGQGDVNQVQVQDPPPFQTDEQAPSAFEVLLSLFGLAD
jgi:hypothetical protein